MGILLAITSGFAGGVLLRSIFSFGWAPICFALLLAALLFFVPRILSAYSPTPLERTSSNFLTGLGAVFFLFAALGMLRMSLADTPLPTSFAAHLSERVAYDGIVVADPDLRDAKQRVEVRVSEGKTSTILLVVAPRSSRVSVGDRVHVTGTLEVPKPFMGDNGRPFRYDRYLERVGVRFTLSFGSIHTVAPAPWYSVPAMLARAKHAFLGGLESALPEPYSSLAGGILIGGKAGLGNELQDAFARSGLIQIIVLSGYNVMVIAEWVLLMFSRTKLSRRWSTAAGALAVLIFVGIAGASATAIRAMLMAFIALYARATGRTYAASRALLIVVFLMLLFNPLYLAFDPGFDLSVAATAGLIWLAPLIETRLIRIKSIFLRGVLATTLAAQVSVLPLLLYETGNLSLVAVPANLIVTPIVPLTMAFSAIAGFAGLILSSIAPLFVTILAFPAYLLNTFIIEVAEKAAALPAAAFLIPLFPIWLVVLLYVALIFIASSKRFSTTSQLRLAKNAST